jgi:hypothetical protein
MPNTPIEIRSSRNSSNHFSARPVRADREDLTVTRIPPDIRPLCFPPRRLAVERGPRPDSPTQTTAGLLRLLGVLVDIATRSNRHGPGDGDAA